MPGLLGTLGTLGTLDMSYRTSRAFSAPSIAAALLSITAPLQAQGPASAPPASPQALLSQWRSAYGDAWRTHINPRTGTVELLFGGHAAPSFEPDTSVDADWLRLTQEWVAATEPMHGVPLDELVADRVFFLPLAQGNTTDKVTVRLRQVVRGVPVEGGSINALFDVSGRLLSLQSTAAPTIDDPEPRPSVDAGFAALVAREDFRASVGVEPNHYSAASLAFAYVDDREVRRWTLAWQVDAQWLVPDTEPRGTTYTIDAHTGRVLRRESSVHAVDVFGTVRTMATPGAEADHPGNPPTPQPVPHVRVTSSAGATFTDANGDFVFPGVNAPLDVTVNYSGTFANVSNQAGASYAVTFNALQPNQPNSLLMNPAAGPLTNSEANAFLWVNRQRDWIRSVFPNDTTADFASSSLVNLSNNCNAFFTGNTTQYYSASSGCYSSSFSSIVAHEMGHWLNVRYSTGNGSDGMGEGNADIFSVYMLDDPRLAANFYTNGTSIRDANNQRQFCGDSNPGCYGGVHDNGEVWMGAAWKIRERLNQTLGDALGDLQSSLLFLGWMNSYDQTTIRSIIESQWLTLDDDDGNINNGTPNYNEIDGGFRQQGFPGFGLQFVQFSNVTQLPSTTDQAGPYVVQADLSATINPPLQSATLRYRVNGGAAQLVPMTWLGGATYSAAIPGQPAPARVEYVIEGADNLGASGSFPSSALAQGFGFAVGQFTPLAHFDFEAAATAWVPTGLTAATGRWVQGDPVGTAAQPEDDHTLAPGVQCWFTGQGAPGGAVGANDIDGGETILRSPRFDLSGTLLGQVSYWRWLSNTQGTSPGEDTLEVEVSNNDGMTWHTVEVVDPTGPEANGGWYRREFSVNSFVTPTANMRLRFVASDLGGDSVVEAAIDDVTIAAVESVVAPPSVYCTTTPNSTGSTGLIVFTGSQSVYRNGAVLRGERLPSSAAGLFFFGSQQAQQSIPGGASVLCIGGTTFRLPVIATDSLFGAAYYELDFTDPNTTARFITPGSTWNFQFWHRDSIGGAATSNTTNAVSVEFGL